jgi:uncharacterized protein YqgC (DUF456 family)
MGEDGLVVYLYAAILLVLNTLGLFLIVLGLPGTWFMVLATALFAWLGQKEGMISVPTLVVLAGLALAGEVVEFAAGAAGSRGAGGSWRGSAGALGGGIAGGILGTFLIPIPVLGSILGACLGAFAGALLGEMSGGKRLEPAIRVGRGAFVGRLLGTVYKLAAGGVIWMVAAVASFV